MKAHVLESYNRITNEVDLHFRTQKALIFLNGTDFKFWDIFSIDTYKDYRFQCHLNDIEPKEEEYHNLTCDFKHWLTDNGYAGETLDEKYWIIYRIK